MLIKRTLCIKEIAFRTISWFRALNLQTLDKKEVIHLFFVPIYTPAPSSTASHAVSEMSVSRLFLQSSFNFETNFLPARFSLLTVVICMAFCSDLKMFCILFYVQLDVGALYF